MDADDAVAVGSKTDADLRCGGTFPVVNLTFELFGVEAAAAVAAAA